MRRDETLTLVVTDAVCRACNMGWLKNVGDSVIPDAVPAMAGDIVVFTPARARLFAAWAVDRALLFELALRAHRKPFFAPPSNFHWLYEHRDDPTPPPGAQVFIAYLDMDSGKQMLPAWHTTGVYPPVGNELEKAEGYIASFSIGHLVLVVFGQAFRETDNHAFDGRPLGWVELPSRYSGYLVPIWPDPDELTRWPPAYGLTRTDLPGFAAWDGLSRIRRYPRP